LALSTAMRFGILGDIHGNREALTAVVDAMRAEGVDEWVQVGDIVGYGPEPSACIDIVRDLGCVVCMGNHDAPPLPPPTPPPSTPHTPTPPPAPPSTGRVASCAHPTSTTCARCNSSCSARSTRSCTARCTCPISSATW